MRESRTAGFKITGTYDSPSGIFPLASPQFEIDFNLPSDPGNDIPVVFGQLGLHTTAVYINNGISTGPLPGTSFVFSSTGGGLDIYFQQFPLDLSFQGGGVPQLYSGTVAAPHFAPGTVNFDSARARGAVPGPPGEALTNISNAVLTITPVPGYTITDLGMLPGLTGSIGQAINNVGEVAGFSEPEPQQAFLWNGTALQGLGTLGGSRSFGSGINDRGQVTGESQISGDTAYRAFIWNGTAMQALGTLAGSNSGGSTINNRGEVTGYSDISEVPSSSGGPNHAFLWNGTTMQDLGTLGGMYGIGSGINDSGEVTGGSTLSNGFGHAFLWNGTTMQDLGTLGGSDSYGAGINGRGEVAGASLTSSNAVHAFLWNGTAMQDLGTLGGMNSYASAINSTGEVVGFSNRSSGAAHAFLWDGTAMLDLNTLLINGDGWELTAANGINDAGQITGEGTISIGGNGHAFLLTSGLPLAILLPVGVTAGPGQCAPFPVALSMPARPNGAFVTLTSSDPTKVVLSPANSASITFFIPFGATVSNMTDLYVCGVNFGSATITATADGFPSASQTVQVSAVLAFSPASATLIGTAALKRLTLNLSAPAPAGGVAINLESDNPAVATVPPTVIIPASATSVTVPITAIAAGLTVIHASALPFLSDTTASVTVVPGLAITTASLSGGQLGVPYSQTLSVTGGTTPYTWTLTFGMLPPGLKFNASTGQISGTPTAPVKNAQLLFTVTDSSVPAQTAQASLTLTIAQ